MNFSTSHIRAYARVHWFALALLVLGTLIIMLSVFEAGVMVGYHEARFTYGLDRNYERTFGGPGIMMHGGLPSSHGSMGTIVSVALPILTVAVPNGPEMQVHVSTSTLIRNQNNTVAPTFLKSGDTIIVLGEPDEDEGFVDARLIRVMPAPETHSAATTPK